MKSQGLLRARGGHRDRALWSLAQISPVSAKVRSRAQEPLPGVPAVRWTGNGKVQAGFFGLSLKSKQVVAKPECPGDEKFRSRPSPGNA